MARPKTPPRERTEGACPSCGHPPPSRNLFRHKAMMNQTELARAVAYNPSLTAGDKAMVLLLICELDFENWISISQAEIARKLGVSRVVVHRHLSKLRDLGIVLDDGRGAGGFKRMKLNAVYAWKGRASAHGRHFHADQAAGARKREEAARRRREKLKVVEPA
jgi:biotin operon repressor